jgi:hypothetical protein
MAMKLEKTKLEREVENRLTGGAKFLGALVVKLAPTFMAGLPDRMILHEGRAFFCECKRPRGGRVSPVQRAVARMFARAGFPVYLISTTEHADWFIGHLRHGNGLDCIPKVTDKDQADERA